MDLPNQTCTEVSPPSGGTKAYSNWNGENFLAKSRVTVRHFCWGCLDEELGNLTSHALFVPIVLRMAETAR